MVIKQAHALQNAISAPVTAAKTPVKTGGASSFSALFGSLTPNPVAKAAYSPVGTIHVSGGMQPASTTSTATSPTAPFTAGFQNGIVTAPDGSQEALNSNELADAPTAQEVASMLGGTITQDTLAGGYTASANTLEISVPGSSNEINAGLAANLFSMYGTGQGSEAWQIINQDLGRG